MIYGAKNKNKNKTKSNLLETDGVDLLKEAAERKIETKIRKTDESRF